jgi:hypothetical protein
MARKRFGQLSKKRKAKIRAKAKNQGLTKKQIRKEFNEKRDRPPLGPVERPSNPFKLQEFPSPFKPGKNFVGPLRDPQPVPDNRSKLTSGSFDNSTPYAPGVSTGSPFGPNSTTNAPGVSVKPKKDPEPTVPEDPPKKPTGPGEPPKVPEEDVDDIPQVDEKDLYPDLPSFLKNNATYLSGASAGGIRRRRSKRSKLGINAMGTNQLKRNFRNMLSIGGINI